VGEVKHKVIPSLDDEFAREVGEYDSLEDLKAKVRDEIMRHKEEDRRSQEREAAITFLVEKNSVECPPSMVERELRSLMMRALSVYGKDVDISEKIKAELEAEYAPIAERHVKAALILDALGKKEGLDASEPDVEAEIEKLAQRTDQAPEKVRQYLLSNEGSLSGLKTQIRERKTIEWLLSKAAVKNPA
jgi:trigger factor